MKSKKKIQKSHDRSIPTFKSCKNELHRIISDLHLEGKPKYNNADRLVANNKTIMESYYYGYPNKLCPTEEQRDAFYFSFRLGRPKTHDECYRVLDQIVCDTETATEDIKFYVGECLPKGEISKRASIIIAEAASCIIDCYQAMTVHTLEILKQLP